MIFSRYAPAIAVIAAAIAPTVLFAADPPAVRTRFHEYTEKWKTPKNPANPLCISYLGGTGNEWASGGGFQSDGSVIVVGTAAGPVFDLAGCPSVKVIGGADGPAPVLTDEQVLKVTVDKKSGKSSTAILLNGTYTAGTPFAAKLDADGKKVQTAIRLPWGVGSCSTGIVDAQGNVYVAGIGGPNLKAISPKALTPTIKAYTTKTGEAAPHQAFLLCLAPDLSSVKWCVSVPDYAFAPELRFSQKGELQLLGGHLNVFLWPERPDLSWELDRMDHNTNTKNQIQIQPPRGGMNSVLRKKPRDNTRLWFDLNGELVLFALLRHGHGDGLFGVGHGLGRCC